LKPFHCKYRLSDGALEVYSNIKKLEERSDRYGKYSHISIIPEKMPVPARREHSLEIYDSISSGRRGIRNVERDYQECSEKQYKKESESQKQFDDIHVIYAAHFAN
jgi:hypothetical protein